MEQVKRILDASFLWRGLMALCGWFGRQWAGSGVIQWFLHPAVWDSALSESSVFYRLWVLVRRGLCRLRAASFSAHSSGAPCRWCWRRCCRLSGRR